MDAFTLHSCKMFLPVMLNDVSMPINRRIRFSSMSAGKSEHFCQRLFLDRGLVECGKPHDHHDFIICLQLISSPVIFFKDLFMKYACHHYLIGRIVRQQDVFKIHLVSLKRCAVQCSVVVKRVSMHLKKKKKKKH